MMKREYREEKKKLRESSERSIKGTKEDQAPEGGRISKGNSCTE